MRTEAKDGARCPECNASPIREVGASFCQHCGQKLEVGTLSLGEVLAEFLGTLMSLEFPILLTTRDLLKGPGRVASAWIAGRRRSYINPVKFVVIVGLIVALTYEPLRNLRFDLHPSGGAVYYVGLANHYTEYFAFFCLILLIPLALFMRVVGPRLGVVVPWLEWYVLGLYCFGLGVLLQLIINIVTLGASTGWIVLTVEFFLPALLLGWGAFGFVPRPLRWRALVTSQAPFLAIAIVVSLLVLFGQLSGGS